MDRYRLLQLLEGYSCATKAKITIKTTLGEHFHLFTIYRGLITHDIGLVGSKSNSMSSTCSNVIDLNLPRGNYKILQIVEQTFYKDIIPYSTFIYDCLDDIQIYLPLFRILGEQVVFIYKHGDTYSKMYFVNGRVFYIEENEENYTVNQLSLRKLFNWKKGQIVFIDRLMNKYTYKSLYNEVESLAKLNNKSVRIMRNGFVVKN